MTPEGSGPAIRAYRGQDLAALYRICLLTGDAGLDASGLYSDPDLLGHLYVGAYATLEPEHAVVLEDGDGVCGYCVGALDTASFHARVREAWLPALQARYPDPAGDPEAWSPDERLMRLLHDPDAVFPLGLAPELRGYPSHLHIDVLPRAQGRGLGRRLLEALLARLRSDGSPGVHLGVDARNRHAAGFYTHLGFTRLALMQGGHAIRMGKRLR